MGARPMQRVIQREIKQPLADELLFGGIAKGGRIRISLAKKSAEKPAEKSAKENGGGALTFTFEKSSNEKSAGEKPMSNEGYHEPLKNFPTKPATCTARSPR